MADPKAKQIVDALQDALGAITGLFAPDRVVKVPVFNGAALDPSLSTIISMSPDAMANETFSFGSTNSQSVLMPVDLALCRKFTEAEDAFNPPERDRWDIQTEFARAVKDKLLADRQLGGLALYMTVPAVDIAADTWVDGWALVFMRVVVQFRHGETTA